MGTNANQQYTVRGVPPHIDRALRRKARSENKSLNEVLLESLVQSVDAAGGEPEFHDLDDCIGTWEDDPAVDAALAAQRSIDRKLWR